ncbi:unnamed protein product [Pedinophyceae sp. YPF-701]|nr:unnamed protein product [Pedinophyceae sp. YPF-701]
MDIVPDSVDDADDGDAVFSSEEGSSGADPGLETESAMSDGEGDEEAMMMKAMGLPAAFGAPASGQRGAAAKRRRVDSLLRNAELAEAVRLRWAQEAAAVLDDGLLARFCAALRGALAGAGAGGERRVETIGGGAGTRDGAGGSAEAPLDTAGEGTPEGLSDWVHGAAVGVLSRAQRSPGESPSVPLLVGVARKARGTLTQWLSAPESVAAARTDADGALGTVASDLSRALPQAGAAGVPTAAQLAELAGEAAALALYIPTASALVCPLIAEAAGGPGAAPGRDAARALTLLAGVGWFRPTRALLPARVHKYHYRRYWLFSRFDEGCALDEEGWFSVTPEPVAKHHARRCACRVAVDAFAGVGGNAIHLARTCESVVAIDRSAGRLAMAVHNAHIYGVGAAIQPLCQDVREALPRLAGAADVVFLSPPWGGPEVVSSDEPYDVSGPDMGGSGLSLPALLREAAACVRPPRERQGDAWGVTVFLPRNTELSSVVAAVKQAGLESWMCPGGALEVQESWVGPSAEGAAGAEGVRLKAVTVYLGGLAARGDASGVSARG